MFQNKGKIPIFLKRFAFAKVDIKLEDLKLQDFKYACILWHCTVKYFQVIRFFSLIDYKSIQILWSKIKFLCTYVIGFIHEKLFFNEACIADLEIRGIDSAFITCIKKGYKYIPNRLSQKVVNVGILFLTDFQNEERKRSYEWLVINSWPTFMTLYF